MRSRAWIWDFTSTHTTTARSGGARYRPTTSRTLSTKGGSRESFQVSTRWGCRPKARQMREIADWESPSSRASERVEGWVASAGVLSRVRTITSSTWASLIVRGRPGRGSSTRPSSRSAAKRARHLAAMPRVTPSRPAICVLFRPSAASRTIRER